MEKLKTPTEVIDSDWRDDVDYEAYADEANYVQPKEVEKATAEEAKKLNVKIGHVALFSKENDKLVA